VCRIPGISSQKLLVRPPARASLDKERKKVLLSSQKKVQKKLSRQKYSLGLGTECPFSASDLRSARATFAVFEEVSVGVFGVSSSTRSGPA
jgi:hypothetical protein